jgi:hypothetical protein
VTTRSRGNNRHNKTISTYQSDSDQESNDTENDAGTQNYQDHKEQEFKPTRDEAEAFIDIFRLNYKFAHDCIHESDDFYDAVCSFIDDVHRDFVYLCLSGVLGAKRKSNETKAREKLKVWVRASPLERPLVVMGMKELKQEAESRLGEDVRISGTTIDEYRKNLVAKLNNYEFDESRGCIGEPPPSILLKRYL